MKKRLRNTFGANANIEVNSLVCETIYYYVALINQ